MYDAMDIAEYILEYCDVELGKPITNLQLQKFLYYIQGANLAINDTPLFNNPIVAWQYGPVVPDVYYSYSNNQSKKIQNVIRKNNILFENSEIEIIESITDILIEQNIWDIVNQSHTQDPWISNKNFSSEIPCDEIKMWFSENWEEIWQTFQ